MDKEALRRDVFFTRFLDDELDLISQYLQEKNIEAGETIVREGEAARSLFILASGSVDVKKRTASGDQPTLSTIEEGAIFGEIALMGESLRTADVVARDQVKVYELSYAALGQLVLQSPAVGNKIYQLIVSSLIEKIKNTTADLLSIVVSSRMAALGEMASGIAHEISSPLAVIYLHAKIIDEKLPKLPESEQALIVKSSRVILSMTERISKLMNSVRALSRDSKEDSMVKSPVSEIIDQTFELSLSRFKNNGIELQSDIPNPALEIECRAIQISQILLNLLSNAFDAVKDLKERWVKVTVKDLGDTVEFVVTDSGNGLTPEVRERIFQSFFTTKKSGHGTGLGLSISLKIARNHHGSLNINPASKNTEFILKVPKVQDTVEEEAE